MRSPSPAFAPTPITRHDIVAELDELLAHDLDAIAAYHVAIERVAEPSLAAQLAAFARDHAGHLQDLCAAVERLGGRPAMHPGDRRIRAEARVLAEAAGGDRWIVEALRANEARTTSRYDDAMRRCGAATWTIKEMLARHLHDERRHRGWLDRWLRINVSA